MNSVAYSVKNEPPKWLIDRAQFLLSCGYSAKRVAELVEIPEWYVKLMKDGGVF